jgi:protein tyrosine phosphatase domain-containing protein 1
MGSITTSNIHVFMHKFGFVGVAPTAKYGAASESIRHTIPEERACAMFCKGKKCKYENVDNWSESEMEVQGLYSNWYVLVD